MKKVRLKVPATIANLVCGFDILGMAIDEPADDMEIRWLETPEIIIRHTDAFGLPEEPAENVAGVVLLKIMEHLQLKHGFEVIIHKKIKPGSGLGSSAASAAGAVVGVNLLLGNILTKEEMVYYAMFGEELASGARHADNIAPCIYGGITLVKSSDPVDIIPLNAPDLWVTAVHPQVEVKTSDAREILKKTIFLKDAIQQWGNIAGLVAGIQNHDHALIGRSLNDVIIEPVRSILIPKFDEIKQKSLHAGALGGGISGSGPSVFMFSEEEKVSHSIAEIMKSAYDSIGIESLVYVSRVNPSGIRIIKD